MIKCNNVQEQAQDLSGQIFARWQELLQSGDFILGDEVLAFEGWMSGRCSGAHAVALNSGTDALFITDKRTGSLNTRAEMLYVRRARSKDREQARCYRFLV